MRKWKFILIPVLTLAMVAIAALSLPDTQAENVLDISENSAHVNSFIAAQQGRIVNNPIPNYPCYRTVEETFATAQSIVSDNPDLAQWLDVGDSWEKTDPGGNSGYDMMVLRLTNRNITGDKPKIFVTSAIHAREYTTAELMTRFAEMMVDGYDTDPDITWVLDHHEVHLMLQANPDGRKKAEPNVL